MSVAPDDVDLVPCYRHPNRLTALHCSKCGRPICPRCVVQTPVGARCAECANFKRLPQFDVGGSLLARSAAAGAGVSIVGWYLLSFAPALRYFLCILVGVAVGEAMSRAAKRRSSVALDVAAVVVVVVGLLIVEELRVGGSTLLSDMANNFGVATSLALPAVIASVVAVVKLR